MNDNSTTFLQDLLSNVVLALFVLMLIVMVQIGNRGLYRIREEVEGVSLGLLTSETGGTTCPKHGSGSGNGLIDPLTAKNVWFLFESDTPGLEIEYDNGTVQRVGDSRPHLRSSQSLHHGAGPVAPGAFRIIGHGAVAVTGRIMATVFADWTLVAQHEMPVARGNANVLSLARDGQGRLEVIPGG